VPLDESEAMRSGLVWSTRAISASAERDSAIGNRPWRASDGLGRSSDGST